MEFSSACPAAAKRLLRSVAAMRRAFYDAGRKCCTLCRKQPSKLREAASCPRLRWNAKDAWLRALQLLQAHSDRYDANQMDWTWWQANIKTQHSKLDVTCRDCGHRSRSTNLNSLQQGTAPGCFCNRAVPWSGQQGHRRCLQMLQERYGDQYDASRMDWTWWQANVQGAESQIDVTCRKCGHRSRSTTLRSFQQGTAPGCFCNRAVPWSGKQGRRRCLQMLQERYGDQYDASRMDWTWWQANVQGAESQIDVTCRKCGHRSRSTNLNNLQQGTAPGCFCNRAVPWSGQQGHRRCLQMLQERYGDQYDANRMDWTWWQANIQTQQSKLDVTCRKCGHRSRSTTLRSFQQGAAPGCFCNRAVPWSGQQGHRRCLQMLQERYGDQYDASRMDWTWWQANVQGAESQIDVTCRKCGHRSRSTNLNNFQQGTAPGCLCTRRTEAKLMQWLSDVFPQLAIASQVSGCKNPETLRTLPFDFGLKSNSILLELDGNIGHFGRGWAGAAEDGGVPQRDFLKEQWAMQHGRIVIRLLQEGVYADSWDWQGFLTSAIQHAIKSSAPCILTQDAMQYKTGIYRRLRRAIPCKAGHFRADCAGRVPYLSYGLPDQNRLTIFRSACGCCHTWTS